TEQEQFEGLQPPELIVHPADGSVGQAVLATADQPRMAAGRRRADEAARRCLRQARVFLHHQDVGDAPGAYVGDQPARRAEEVPEAELEAAAVDSQEPEGGRRVTT